MPEFKYKAFISYRHIEPDMQAAEKLQKLLESYKPPKNIGKEKGNWRIFRDVSELQSSSDLSEDIKNAIETSEYLIVICSPKYTESKWCLQELSRFRELHNNSNDNIITLLVSGDPKESFPEELTYREMTTTNENGEEVKVKVEVEPLAANIKADSLKESMKKLNTEYLRIAAPLLGCDFNDLFQREKRREAARRRRVFGTVSGVLSLITVISVASALTINKKNVQIKEQNKQIEMKNTDLLIENAGHLAVESENLYKGNDLIPAIQKAVAALPADGEKKPVIAEAEYALSRELGMFSHQQIVPQIALKHDCAVEQLSFMGEGKTIVSEDATGIYFWDAQSGELIRKITGSDDDFSSEINGSSNELNAFFDVNRDKTGTYFDNTSSPSRISYEESAEFGKIYTCFAHSVDEDEPAANGDIFVYNSDFSVWRLDSATGDILWKTEFSDKAYKYYDIRLVDDCILRIYQTRNDSASGISFPGDKFMLEIIDRESGKIKDEITLSGVSDSGFGLLSNVSIKSVKGDMIYLYDSFNNMIRAFQIKDHSLSLKNEIDASEDSFGSICTLAVEQIENNPVVIKSNILALERKTQISRYDNELGKAEWTAEIPVNYQNNGDTFLFKSEDSNANKDVLAVVTNYSISFIDYKTGDILKNITLNDQMIDHSFTKTGLLIFTLEDGNEYVASIANYIGDTSKNAVFRVQKMNGSLTLCSYSLGRYATAENYSNTAYIQYPTNNEMFTNIDTGEHMYSKEIAAVSDDGTLAAISSSFYADDGNDQSTQPEEHFFIYNTDNDKLTEISDLENIGIIDAEFIGNDVLFAVVIDENVSSIQPYLVRIDVKNGSVSEVDNVPYFNKTNTRLFKGTDGIFFASNSFKDLSFVSVDGSVKNWEADNGNNNPEKTLIDDIFAVNGTKAALYTKYSEDNSSGIEIFDADGNDVKLECELSPNSGLSVKHIFWLNDERVGVLFSNRKVSLYDSESGKLDKEIDLDGLTPEPISAERINNESFAVLCRDSCIYSVSADGSCSGKGVRLEFADELENDIRESDSDSAYKFRIVPSSDPSYVYAVWDDNQAWLVSAYGLSPRYRIDNFSNAPSGRDIVFINSRTTNTIGYFPIYSTQQLLDTAKKYLSGLGITGKE